MVCGSLLDVVLGHFLWKPRLPWKRIALSILNDPTTILVFLGLPAFPGSKKKAKTVSTNGCANLHRKTILVGRVFVDLSVLGGFWEYFYVFWLKIRKSNFNGISMRIWVPRGGRTRAGKGGGWQSFSGFFRIGLHTPCGSPTDCRGGFGPSAPRPAPLSTPRPLGPPIGPSDQNKLLGFNT